MEIDPNTRRFREGAHFNKILMLYRFDSELKVLLFRAIQEIEIAMRTRIIHHFSLQHGAFWFMDASLFKNALIHDDCITNIRAELSRTKEDFIKEHFAKYDSPSMPPAWKTLEMISFGTLGKLYSNFSDNAIKKVVARGFNVPQHIYLESWIASLAALRNCCAHHARVWNRVYPIKPRLPNAKRMRLPWINSSNIASNKLYAIVCCLLYWVNNILSNNTFKTDMINLLEKYPIVDPAAMGFPHGWEEEPLWLNH